MTIKTTRINADIYEVRTQTSTYEIEHHQYFGGWLVYEMVDGAFRKEREFVNDYPTLRAAKQAIAND